MVKRIREDFDENPNLTSRQLIWLLGNLLLMLGPHLLRMPILLVLYFVIVVAYRWLMQMGRSPYPAAMMRAGMVALSLMLFFISYRFEYTVNSAITFFSVFVVLKLIELKRVKNSYGFSFISLYLGAMQFLISQTLLTALYYFAAIIGVFGFFLYINQHSLTHYYRRSATDLLKYFVIAIPFVVLLFLFFPRLAPLWTMPLATGQAKTGMSDVMSPGDIASLSQSAERVFRVSFEGAIPEKSALYWRGLFLDVFDGRSWRSSDDSLWQKAYYERHKGQPGYQMLLEPSGNTWGYSLDGYAGLGRDVVMRPNGLAQFSKPLETAVMVDFYPYIKDVPALSASARKRNLYAGRRTNPRTRQWVAEMRQQYPEDKAFIQQLLNHYNQQPFFYTLTPPALGEHSIDEFLFDTRKGFCEHFASSFTFMLRVAGIPARVVVGYQGGEVNENGNYLIVHQYDAHAWVEVWLEPNGWVRIDPTAQVAPERIMQSLEQAVRSEGSFLSESVFAVARYSQTKWLQWARLRWDAVNYNWQKWVVGYNEQNKAGLLGEWQGWLKAWNWQTILKSIFAFLSLGLAWVAIRYWLYSRRRAIELRLLDALEWRLGKQGLARDKGETVSHYLARASARRLAAEPLFKGFKDSFYELQYNDSLSDADRQRVRQKLRQQYRVLRVSMSKVKFTPSVS